MGMKATLVAITILQCNDSSMAMSVKENLKTDLSRAIEEMNRVLTTTSRPTQAITMPRVISVEKPSEDLDCECMAHHTDINTRRRVYPFLGRMQLAFTAKLISSACPGQSGSFNLKLKQLQAQVIEG